MDRRPGSIGELTADYADGADRNPIRLSGVRQAHPFDGFDRLPFDRLRVCDTASRLRMTPSGVEGLALVGENSFRGRLVRASEESA